MTKRDRAAMNIEFVRVEMKLTVTGDYLRGECFIELDEIDVVEFHPRLFQQAARSRDGPDAHDLRVDTGLRVSDDASHRRQPGLLHCLAADDDHAGRTIG